MHLHSTWVDHIFAKLTVRYGAAFMRQWPDADPIMLKADWAEVLGGFAKQPDALTYAIENLPDTPVNALQFRALARRGPSRTDDVLRLGESGPVCKPSPEMKARLENIKCGIHLRSGGVGMAEIMGDVS